MKVALLVPSFGLDGAVSTPTIRLLAAGLAERCELHVFPLRYPPPGPISLVDGATVHLAGGAGLRFRSLVAATVTALRREHRRAPFGLLHAIWLHEPGTVAIVAGSILRVPVVASIGGAEVASIPHIAYGALRTRLGRLATSFVLRRATRVTGGSRYVLRLARAHVSHDRYRWAPLPVDTDQFHPIPGRPLSCSSAPRLLHAASLLPVKDQTSLLRAYAEIRTQRPATTLTLAGEDHFGLRPDLERLVRTLDVAAGVRFLGPLAHELMPELYQQADLFLLTSLHESQAMVVLEAAASGVPTVGTNVGVVPELVPHGCVAVPAGDPAALARATLELLADVERLTTARHSVRRRAIDAYAVAPTVERFLEVYTEVTARVA